MINYLKKFIPFSLFVAIGLFLLGLSDLFKPVMQFAWICFGVFFILSVVVYQLSAKSMHGRFQNFMNIFFLGIILKLFITGALVIIYKKNNPEGSTLAFAVPFALIYFSFLAFETILLVRLSKQK